MAPETPDWEFKDRDIVILKELVRNPQLSARELTTLLEEEHGINVSHVTVSKSIRNMRDAGVFREAVVPNEGYFKFALFEFQFNPENFADEWRDAMEFIRDHRNTIFYCLSDGDYQWKSLMMFPSHEAEAKWLHEFYKKHGSVVNNVRNSTMINILKFGTHPDLFESLRPDAE
jgi:DNA-binding Lrp family transcriptional regulator